MTGHYSLTLCVVTLAVVPNTLEVVARFTTLA